MRALHISDLHLGKRLLEFSLIEDQKYILNQLLELVEEEKIDVVLLAGDVFDKSVPSEEAVNLFDDFLTSLAAASIEVCIISGNHDSAERLGFGKKLLRKNNIYLASVYDGNPCRVIVKDDYGTVNIFLLPFVKPSYVRRYVPEDVREAIVTYQDAVQYAVKSMQVDVSQRNIIVAHQFVTGAATCDSEEHILGGLDNVDAGVFADFDYVALGHIHSPQNLAGGKIRYCGTLLKYSVSEISQSKSATIIELRSKGNMEIYQRELKPLRDLRKIKGRYEQLIKMERTCSDDYVYVELTDEEEQLNAVNTLRRFYPRLLRVAYEKKSRRYEAKDTFFRDVSVTAPLELFREFYTAQHDGAAMSEAEADFVRQLLERAGGDR
ncbi:MAG: exonuclease SbcCD subunit D [Acidaminococcaceae bacterium]|nr:exonuclease SbcCD subunit D [Acidaminococcaceae bacterium]